MFEDSFKFAAEDLKARQLIEARTEADAIVRATQKALSRGGHLVGAEETAAITASIAALEALMAGEDHRAIRAAIGETEKVTHHLAEVLMDSSLKEALQQKKISDLP